MHKSIEFKFSYSERNYLVTIFFYMDLFMKNVNFL